MRTARVNVSGLDESTLRTLLVTPPSEFVAARNACAKALRAGGHRDDAALVMAIRRPAWVDWALNRAAVDHPDAAAGFADAAGAMRHAQDAAVEGRNADVAAALRALRDRTAELVRRANSALTSAGRPPDVAELTERIAAVAADAAATEQLRVALLRAGDDAVDVIAGLPGASTTATVAADHRATPDTATSPARVRRVAAPTPDANEARARTAAERRGAMRELADTQRAHRTAAHELARAERAVLDAEAKRAAAQSAVARARTELDEAMARLTAATERRSSLERDVAAAEQRTIDLRARLDDLAVDS